VPLVSSSLTDLSSSLLDLVLRVYTKYFTDSHEMNSSAL
jgi:hypothetical protein